MAKPLDQNSPRKTVVIGLDGATFDVFDPYLRAGILPNFARLLRNGIRGPLEAAIPPVTGPSWVSFMTGMGPGRHGVYDFVKPRPNSIKRQAISYRDIQAKTLWEYLSEAGKAVGVVNLPITYPPPKVNGFVIPGLLTPNAEGEFAHPDGLMSELEGSIGKYVLDVWWQKYGEAGMERFLEEMAFCTEQRCKAIFYLLEKKPWDLFMGVFIGTDRVQHYLWQYIHPDPDRTLTPREKGIVSKVADYYRRIDRFLGNLMDRLDGKADILIVSDHGFGPLKNKMFINRWLEQSGYLRIDDQRKRSVSLKGRVFRLLRQIVRTLDPLEYRKKIGIRMKRTERMSAYDFLDCIDWNGTRAYSASNTEQGIYINLKGREPQGTVDGEAEYLRLREEIIRRLQTMKDPETGLPMPTKIFRREDLYEGPYVGNAPDIVVFLSDGECLVDVQIQEETFTDAGWHTGSGTHRLDGILMGCGPRLERGVEVQGARIIDLAPTLLHLQGLPVPEGMDGRPLLEALDKRFLEESPVVHAGGNGEVSSRREGEPGLSDREQADVEEKLRGLGYL